MGQEYDRNPVPQLFFFNHTEGARNCRGGERTSKGHTVQVITYDWKTFVHCYKNKAGYTATEVACEWAGTIFDVTRPCGQEQ